MFSIGELIRWYETYANDDIVRDTGVGVLLECCSFANYQTYKVFRVERQDIVYLSDEDIAKLNKKCNV